MSRDGACFVVGAPLLAVDSVSPVTTGGPVEVYNIEVEGSHTYYAGHALALVHNDCAPRRPRADVIREVADPDESITYTKIIDGEEVSVTYNERGHPDFSPFAHPDYPDPVQIEYSGRRGTDSARANRAIGLDETPRGYTWHHMEDGESMLLVRTNIHGTKSGFPHTGGFSLSPR
jgi:hypothetical protein